MAKLRVLVVDDSAYNRQTLTEYLTSHAEIEVVGKAYDGEEGLKLAAQLKPDLITLDIEMPRMDGFTFLRLLMSQLPTPVIVISSHSRKHEVFQALELGAIDFIAKPTHHITAGDPTMRDELVEKALTVRYLRVMQPVPARPRPAQQKANDSSHSAGGEPTRLVCLGASTGGPPALESMFRALGSHDGVCVLVAQHMPAKFTKAFAERLNRLTTMRIVEAESGQVLEASTVYIAPGGQNMIVEPRADSRLQVAVSGKGAADHYLPSIDLLLESVAKHAAMPTLAAVLTGMGSDGSRGIRAIRSAGGITLAEAESTAVVFGMPKKAIDTGAVQEVLGLEELIERIHRFCVDAE